MSSVPLLRLFKDETLSPNQLEKLNEIWEIFRDDAPKWITRQECMTLKNVENCIFIFYAFEGPAFNHLKDLKAKIIGANLMLTTLRNNKKIPKSLVPILSNSMLDLTVCCTNIDKQLRESIYEMVLMMRGKVCKIFTENVTHLVTNEVGSPKYHAAAQIQIPVMLAEWVLQVWKDSQEEEVFATDAKYLKYKCPIFHKYIICASGFNEAVKAKLKEQIESNGGTYSGDLIMGTTTHLIVKDPKGAKFDAAKLWKVPIVRVEWVQESISNGYCLPEKNFLIVSSSDSNQTSTPTIAQKAATAALSSTTMAAPTTSKAASSRPPDIDISCINSGVGVGGDKLMAAVNDTEVGMRAHNTSIGNFSMSFASSSPATAASTTLRPTQTTSKVQTKYPDLVKELATIGKITITLFDGIGIYFENFERVINEKLKKLSDLGGATRFDEYNSDVTHVIINNVNEKLCKQYLELNPEVNIVTIDWFIDSCKKNHIEECKNYCAYKNALNSVKTPKKRARPESAHIATNDSDLNACLSQYLQAEAAVNIKPVTTNPQIASKTGTPSSATTSFMARIKQEQQLSAASSPNIQKSTTTTPQTSGEFRVPLVPPVSATTTISTDKRRSVNETTLSGHNDTTISGGVFSGMSFEIVGFEEDEFEDLKVLLTKNGAKLVTFDPDISNLSTTSAKRGGGASSKKATDYVLLPMISPAPISNPNQVTILWMRKCIEKNELVALNEDIFYQPIPKFNTDRPLSECVITISGIDQPERDNIARLCEAIGARVQKSLSSKATGQFLPNTHLICREPLGPKYEAAKNWKIPIVYPEWAIDCCVTGVRVEEDKFSVENGHNALATQLIEILDGIRTNSYEDDDDDESNATRTRNEASITQQQQQMQQSSNNLNDSSFTANKNESKKPRLEEDDYYRDQEAAPNNEETRADEIQEDEEAPNHHDSDADLALAAMNNSLLQKQQQQQQQNTRTPSIAAGFNTPTVLNPRIHELRRTGQFMPPPVSSNSGGSVGSSPSESNLPQQQQQNVLQTPVWAKPGAQNRQIGGDMKFTSFDYEGAIESLRTPDNVRASRMASGETPDLAVAILAALEHAKNPNFYAPYESPIEYGFQKKNRPLHPKEQQQQNQQAQYHNNNNNNNNNIYNQRDNRNREAENHVEEDGSNSSDYIEKENIETSNNDQHQQQQQAKATEIDPKRVFLEQLGATLKQTTAAQQHGANTSEKKKLAKNKSDINKTESVSNEASNNFSDDTQLMAKFAFGDAAVDANSVGSKNSGSAKNANNFIDDDDENLPRHSSFRRRGNFGSKDDSRETRANKKLAPSNNINTNNAIMPSQIQVTSWREDHPAPVAVAPLAKSATANRANKNAAAAKAVPQSGVAGRKSKGDGSIAERIVTAASSASSKKN